MGVLFSPEIFSAQATGGISRYFVELFKNFCKDGYDFSVFEPYRNALLKDAFDQIPELEARLVSLSGSPPRDRKRHRVIEELRFEALVRRSRPDVVHETYYPLTGFTRSGKPTITTIHDLMEEREALRWQDRLRNRLKRASAERADHVVAVSQATKNDLELFWGIPGDKITVIHHGVSDAYGKSERLVRHKPYFLYVGRRGGYKNFSRLLEGFAMSRAQQDAQLLAFGGGTFTREEHEQLSRLGLSSSVEHLAGDDEVLRRAYAGAVAHVCPSICEGFGMTVLEAMASGCPVIASQVTSIPEVGGTAAHYMNAAEPESIASELDTVFYDADLQTRLEAAGLVRARQFTWQQSADKHRELYETLR